MSFVSRQLQRKISHGMPWSDAINFKRFLRGLIITPPPTDRHGIDVLFLGGVSHIMRTPFFVSKNFFCFSGG